MKPGRIIAIVIALLLLVALMPKACAQVMLPHRHSVNAPPIGGFYNVDCGSPPVWTNLAQWLCVKSLQGTNSQLITNWPDISPQGINGVYFTNLYSDSIAASYITTNGLNGNPYLAMGAVIGSVKRSAYANSNAWWTGVSQAEIFMVIDAWDTNQTANALNQLTSATGAGNQEFLWNTTYNPPAHPVFNFGSTAIKDLATTNNFKAGIGPTVLNMWSGANNWGASSNGIVMYSTAVNTVGWPASAGKGIVGASDSYGGAYLGNLYELLIYTNILAAADRTNIVNWLRGKYGF